MLYIEFIKPIEFYTISQFPHKRHLSHTSKSQWKHVDINNTFYTKPAVCVMKIQLKFNRWNIQNLFSAYVKLLFHCLFHNVSKAFRSINPAFVSQTVIIFKLYKLSLNGCISFLFSYDFFSFLSFTVCFGLSNMYSKI